MSLEVGSKIFPSCCCRILATTKIGDKPHHQKMIILSFTFANYIFTDVILRTSFYVPKSKYENIALFYVKSYTYAHICILELYIRHTFNQIYCNMYWIWKYFTYFSIIWASNLKNEEYVSFYIFLDFLFLVISELFFF